MEKPSHAVSTCSPDCPTDSAVERALVDLEWRREAAGKRNGNTHRINTQEPEERQGLLPTRPHFLMKRNGAGYEWTVSANPQTPRELLALTQLLDTQAQQRHSCWCLPLWMHPPTRTPGLDSRYDASISQYGNMSHEDIRSLRVPSKPQSGQQEDGLLTQLTRCVINMWCICHHAPKTKAESSCYFNRNWMNHRKGVQQLEFHFPWSKCLLFCCPN